MNNVMRLAVLAAAAAALVGCGGAKIGSKEEAARFAGLAGEKGSSRGSLLSVYQSAADTNGTFTASCTNGGTVTGTIATSGGSGTGSLVFNLDYDNCTEPSYDDPSTEEVEKLDVTSNGSLQMSWRIDITHSSIASAIALKGRIDLSGAVSDFIDMDITESFVLAGTDSSIALKFVIDGTIATSSETYTYEDETYTVTAEGRIKSES